MSGFESTVDPVTLDPPMQHVRAKQTTAQRRERRKRAKAAHRTHLTTTRDDSRVAKSASGPQPESKPISISSSAQSHMNAALTEEEKKAIKRRARANGKSARACTYEIWKAQATLENAHKSRLQSDAKEAAQFQAYVTREAKREAKYLDPDVAHQEELADRLGALDEGGTRSGASIAQAEKVLDAVVDSAASGSNEMEL